MYNFHVLDGKDLKIWVLVSPEQIMEGQILQQLFPLKENIIMQFVYEMMHEMIESIILQYINMTTLFPLPQQFVQVM